MSREVHIPLALWISAALVCHALGGGGTAEVAQTVLDKKDLRALVQSERQQLRPEDRAFEVLSLDQPPTPNVEKAAPPDKDSDPSDEKVDPDPDAKPEQPKPVPVAKEKDKEKEPPPTPEVAAAKPPEPEKKKPVLVPAVPVTAAPAAPPPPPPPPDKRLAVQQHAEKNQPDNPNAPRTAEDANHVKEETMARIRSHDQDMANPSPGAPKSRGPQDKVGNSEKDKEAESEDKEGRDDRAPGEAARVSTSATHSTPAVISKAPMQMVHPPSAPGAGQGLGARATGPTAEQPQSSPGGQGPSSPEVQMGGAPVGGWSMDPANPGGDGSSRVAGRKRPGKPFQNPVHVGSLGLGGVGVAGGPNINLTMPGMQAAVGDEKLRQEREADGASRRGEHAGRMAAATNFQKYRAAIENYDPSVKPGDKTSLNAARSAFATYLVTIHNKIHPFFADRELDHMDHTGDKMFSDQKMMAVAELVISPDTGRIVRRGIVKNSGSTAFDMIVLKSIDSSGPYGKAPDAVVSYDGKVYLHWEFYRNRNDACSNRNAYPIIKRPPAGGTTVTPTPPGAPPKTPPKTPDEGPPATVGPLRPLRD